MKRHYLKPEIVVFEITQNQIICSSDGFGLYNPTEDTGDINEGNLVW